MTNDNPSAGPRNAARLQYVVGASRLSNESVSLRLGATAMGSPDSAATTQRTARDLKRPGHRFRVRQLMEKVTAGRLDRIRLTLPENMVGSLSSHGAQPLCVGNAHDKLRGQGCKRGG